MGEMPLDVEMFPGLSFGNRENLKVSGVASCYQCMRVVPVSDITEFVDNGKTALCPHCDIDSLVAGSISLDLLRAANERWFGRLATKEEMDVIEKECELPTFTALSWHKVPGRGFVAHTKLDKDRDEAGMAELAQSRVIVNGREYLCSGVERFMHSAPWVKGEDVGILIETHHP